MWQHLPGKDFGRRRALRQTAAGPLHDYLAVPFPARASLCRDAEIVSLDLETTGLDPAGKPHATFEVGEGMGLHHGGPKQTHHYRWTGQEWITGGSTELPASAVGDMLVSTPQDVSLLLGGDEVAWWHSTDGGQSFVKGETLIKHKRTWFSISSMIRNAHPDARVIAAGNNRTDKNDFREMYLLGDNGPVKRPKSEADQADN